MHCCKAEIYGWCGNLETVYTDTVTDESFCVFHAPRGKKGCTLEDFNKKVKEKILYFIQSKKRLEKSKNEIPRDLKCDLSGTIFEGEIKFSEYKDCIPLPHDLIFFQSEFFHVSFSHAKFDGDVDFRACKFENNSFFIGTQFKGEADFRWTIFCTVPNRVNKVAWFTGAVFGQKADFGDVKFEGDVDFSRARFESGITRFLKINSSNVFDGKADFSNCVILKDASLYFEDAHLKKATFLGTNLSNMDFLHCGWLVKHKRLMLYDEILINANQLKWENWFFKNNIETACDKVENLYRQLKKKSKDKQNEVEVSDWHYGEKEIYRKKSRRRRFFSFAYLYWLSSGYGERYGKALFVLFVGFLAISLLMLFFGLVPYDNNPVEGIPYIKAWPSNLKEVVYALYNTFQYATYVSKPYFKPQSIFGEIFLIFSAKILIPLQAALFTFALRNKFKR